MTEMADTIDWDSDTNSFNNSQDSYINIDSGSEQVRYILNFHSTKGKTKLLVTYIKFNKLNTSGKLQGVYRSQIKV